LSVAVIQPPAVIYREEQYFAWWIYALLAAIVGLGWLSVIWPHHPAAVVGAGARAPGGEVPFSLLLGLVLPPALVIGILRMTTEVLPSQCRVWYGFVPTYRKAISLEAVSRIEIISYRAIHDHLFWGVRTTRDGEKVMTARGSRAVRLHMRDGSRILIGSQKPEELAESIERARRSFTSS
jgi:hypothetical protein